MSHILDAGLRRFARDVVELLHPRSVQELRAGLRQRLDEANELHRRRNSGESGLDGMIAFVETDMMYRRMELAR